MSPKRMAALGATLALCACTSGMQYALQEYSGVEVKPFAVEGEDVYRIFDKPEQNKLMISPSIAKAAMMGSVQGATFGALSGDSPKPVYERTALAYLASTGRTCRIVDSYLVERPEWEFKYDCNSPPPTVASPASQSHRKR